MTAPNDFYDKEFDFECLNGPAHDNHNIQQTIKLQGLGFGKLFLAIFLAGFCLFVVIGGFFLYGLNETAKAMEKESIKQIKSFKIDIDKTFDELLPQVQKKSDTKQEVSFSDQSPMEGYFKDSDGVWRSKDIYESEFYKDTDGVWKSHIN